nr:restriction endonuclease subunit S [uncultured Treponema sp.]
MELGKVIKSLNTGLNPRKFFQLNTPDAEFYYVTIKEMVNGKIVYNENTDRLNAEALRLCNNRSNLEKGDVLFTGTGTIGKTVVLTETPTTWNIKEGVYTIKPIPEKLDSNYLAFALSSTAIRSRYMTNVAGGTVKSLKMADLEKTDIPLPSLPEQQKIAAHLDSIQSAIDNKKQQFQQLDELVKSKFVEMFGENPVESGKWKVGKIESVVDRNILTAKKKFQKTDIIKYVDISAIDNKTNLVTGFTEYILEDAPSRAQQAINCDDILISTVRPNLRNIAINPFNDNSMVGSSGFCVLRVNETCNAKYLFYCVLGDDFTNAMVDLTTGAAYPAIKDSDVLAYSIAVPPIELQNTFAEYVQKIDSAKSIIKTQLADLQELLDSKMDEYFGE